jgi:hypothetical protein
MPPQDVSSPAHRGDGGRAQENVGSSGHDNSAHNRRCARRQYVGRHTHALFRRNGEEPTCTVTLAIEHAITEDEPTDGQPWSPPEAGHWELVCRRPAERTTVWRRIALTPGRP